MTDIQPGDDWHAVTKADVESRLQTSDHGLSPDAVTTRLAEYGLNVLPAEPAPTTLALFVHQFRSPLIFILVLAALATVLLGEYTDTAVIGVTLLLNAVIGFVQERRAGDSARALRRLLTLRARVIRSGHEQDIDASQLVPGDVVLLESGCRVPADVRLTSTTALQIDEALLTGESLPASKEAAELARETQLADRANIAFQGTIVVTGRGRGYVVATGLRSQLGLIASELRQTEDPVNPLEERIVRFGHTIGLAVGGAALIALAIGIARGHSLVELILIVVAIAVAGVPEELPIAFTITLAIGVQRMARRNAIIRELPAVETLGSTTVIGSDKTGTLTENRMAVQQIWTGERTYQLASESNEETGDLILDGTSVALPEHQAIYQLLLAGILTNEAVVLRTENGFDTQGDPTESAILIAGARLGMEPEHVRSAHPVVIDLPFEPERQYSLSVRNLDGNQVVFVKGAPERILGMCSHLHTDRGRTDLDVAAVQQTIDSMAAQGLRVLGLASRRLSHPLSPQLSLPDLHALDFLGCVGMMDPLRSGVRDAVAGCHAAGIRVIMITGDHARTAKAIGQSLGISTTVSTVLSGSDLVTMDDEQLRNGVKRASVFARVSPAQKLRIVQALQQNGEVVAVTGDGANDAPALRAADIGIAMGKGGTDVAREAASMVLADDNFVSIYAAVEEGRIIFNNIRNVTFFLVSTGAATVFSLLVAMALGWPPVFLPTQVIWMNIVTTGLQDMALAFEPGERNVLKRPPRAKREGLLSNVLWERTLISGVVMGAASLLLFWWQWSQSGSLVLAQTVALTTMVVLQTIHIGNSRSEWLSLFKKSPFSNRFLFLSSAAALVVHIIALYSPPTQFILRVAPIPIESWIMMLPTGLALIAAIEIHKWLRYRQRPSNINQ